MGYSLIGSRPADSDSETLWRYKRAYGLKLVSLLVTPHPALPEIRNKGVLTNVLPSPHILLAMTLRQSYFTFLCLGLAICLVGGDSGTYFRVVVQIKDVNIRENRNSSWHEFCIVVKTLILPSF